MTVYVLLRFDLQGNFINFDVFSNKELAVKAYKIAEKQFKCILQPRVTADEFYDF
jgi:hypothetical protein